MTVRVRFAPSPTGYLHVGGGRTALYNWLFARHNGGTMILRSDDTDRERSTDEFSADILESMRWLGLDWDEGIVVGGPHSPYRQSLRIDRYQAVAHELVASGLAYFSFETAEQLETFRAEAQAHGRPPAYDGRHRLEADAAQRRIAAGESAPIRFAVPRPGETVFQDVVRGEVRFDHVQIDDFVILRSDGTPTYHLASTVDDADFDISHVVRGEDLLSSTPKHILLAQALGHTAPVYAHLPLLTGPDGTKLSKRHGHTSIHAYRQDGYLAEAMRNYLAILSWSPGEEEVVTLTTMAERFDLSAVSKSPAVFDVTKLEWMSGVYVRRLSVDEFVERALPFVAATLGRELDEAERAVFADIAPLVQERTKLLTEIGPQVRFLFGAVEYDATSWDTVMTRPEVGDVLRAAASRLAGVEPWRAPHIEEALRHVLEELGLSARKGLQPLRVAVTGSSISPPLFESLAAAGKETTLSRLADAAGRL